MSALAASLRKFAKDNDYDLALVLEAARYLEEGRDRWMVPPVDIGTWIREPGYRLSAREHEAARKASRQLERNEGAPAQIGGLYPEVMASLEEICDGEHNELVCTGGIGSGKTTIALEVLLYVLYRLLCLKAPQREFGLDPASEIEIVFQSVTLLKAKGVGYDRFKTMVERSPWFQEFAPRDPKVTSMLLFPNHRIIVKPVASHLTGAMGENVIGGIIDETEFQQVVKESTRAAEVGGVYDQAASNYNQMTNRISSRFGTHGMLCLVSSANRTGGLIERRAQASNDNPRIYVFRKTAFEVKPWQYFKEKGKNGKTWFEVFVGDKGRVPFIVGNRGRQPSPEDRKAGLVVKLPNELRTFFENDIQAALRDHAGVSTDAIHPFIIEKDKVAACFGKTDSIFPVQEIDLQADKLTILPDLIQSPEKRRFVHVDLAVTQDCAGFAVGFCEGFERVQRGPGEFETMPKVVIDGALRVKPPPGGEIDFSRVREVIYTLVQLGMNVQYVTCDKFQSVDFLQQVKNKDRERYRVGTQSMDESTWAYDVTKQALYDGRVRLPIHDVAQDEFIQLERDISNPKKPKVDHKPTGSKDVSDAIAGVVAGLSRRIEVWVDYGISPGEVPASLQRPARDGKDKDDEREAT